MKNIKSNYLRKIFYKMLLIRDTELAISNKYREN